MDIELFCVKLGEQSDKLTICNNMKKHNIGALVCQMSFYRQSRHSLLGCPQIMPIIKLIDDINIMPFMKSPTR